MNQTETRKALEATKQLRGTLEETRQILEAIAAARQHFAVISDDIVYKVEVLRERVEMQSAALEVIERLLHGKRGN